MRNDGRVDPGLYVCNSGIYSPADLTVEQMKDLLQELKQQWKEYQQAINDERREQKRLKRKENRQKGREARENIQKTIKQSYYSYSEPSYYSGSNNGN